MHQPESGGFYTSSKTTKQTCQNRNQLRKEIMVKDRLGPKAGDGILRTKTKFNAGNSEPLKSQ